MFKKIFIVTILIFLLAQPVVAVNIGGKTWGELRDQMYAAGTASYGTAPTEKSMAQIVAAVINAFLSLLGLIFVVLIIFAGFNWMTAAGEEEKINTAKSTIQRAIIGLVIIVVAYGITYFIFSRLPGGPGSGGPGVTSACPLFYSWDGQQYAKDTTFIYKLDQPSKEGVQLRELKYLDYSQEVIKAKIVEEEAEISYLDMIKLLIIDQQLDKIKHFELQPVYTSRDLDKILKADNQYLITKQGDEVLIKFEKAPRLEPGWSRRIYLKAEGYYQELK